MRSQCELSCIIWAIDSLFLQFFNWLHCEPRLSNKEKHAIKVGPLSKRLLAWSNSLFNHSRIKQTPKNLLKNYIFYIFVLVKLSKKNYIIYIQQNYERTCHSGLIFFLLPFKIENGFINYVSTWVNYAKYEEKLLIKNEKNFE